MGSKMINEIQDSEVPHWDKTFQFCTELAKGYKKKTNHEVLVKYKIMVLDWKWNSYICTPQKRCPTLEMIYQNGPNLGHMIKKSRLYYTDNIRLIDTKTEIIFFILLSYKNAESFQKTDW